MNQSFFSLSLGIGSMAIFGSYLKKDRSLMGEVANVICLDTFVAFTCRFIIFSPRLLCIRRGSRFRSQPGIHYPAQHFNNMAGGRI